MVHWLAERYDPKSNIMFGGFRSQLQASYASSHTEELWYNVIVYLWMTKYMILMKNKTYYILYKFKTSNLVIKNNSSPSIGVL